MDASTIGTTPAQLFSSPSADRTTVEITNCEDPTANPDATIYVWHANTVSATVWCEKLGPSDSRQFDLQDQTEFWIVGSEAAIHYTAMEK